MFDVNPVKKQKRIKTGNANNMNKRGVTRPQALIQFVDEVMMGMDRYHQWWTGPEVDPETTFFKPESWGSSHSEYKNAIFTVAMQQGGPTAYGAKFPNDFHLFLGSARRVYDGDLVIAVESSTMTEELKQILISYKAIVYVLPSDLCSKETVSIFCGSGDERVPSSVFRYYFYEKWAAHYSTTSLILFADFRDVFFQSDPFAYERIEWYPDYQLVLFQEFFPNMVLNRCVFNKKILAECYGEETLRAIGHRVIISSGAGMGIRDAVIAWSHHMTMDAPGRITDTRCTSGGIDHSFINYLVYANKLKTLMKIKLFHQGEGPVNSVGGLHPNTVSANLTGGLENYWKILSKDGYILNWNGLRSPVVHQIDHFIDELAAKANSGGNDNDRMWHTLGATRCLWGC